MNNQQGTAIKPRLTVIDGQVTTTSLVVAEHFEKLHKNVIRDIKNLECSPKFAKLNFELCYLNNKYRTASLNPTTESPRTVS